MRNFDSVIEKEREAVRELGETIGYGHIMWLASECWQENFEEKGYPVEGVLVPVLLYDIEKLRKARLWAKIRMKRYKSEIDQGRSTPYGRGMMTAHGEWMEKLDIEED